MLRRFCTYAIIPGLLLMQLAPTAASESETFTRHNLGVFLGGTDEPGSTTEFTWGVEYGFRFAPRIGMGVVYEKTGCTR